MVEQRQMDSTVDWSYDQGAEYSLDVNISGATKPMWAENDDEVIPLYGSIGALHAFRRFTNNREEHTMTRTLVMDHLWSTHGLGLGAAAEL